MSTNRFLIKHYVNDISAHTDTSEVTQSVNASSSIPATHTSNARVSAIEFKLMSSDDMRNLSSIDIINRNLYNPVTREPLLYGVLDRSMGISDKKSLCQTCHKNLNDCIGHFGLMELQLPSYHIGYFKSVQQILQMICKSCSRILLDTAQYQRYTKLIHNRVLDRRAKQHIHNDILALCKKRRHCVHCLSYNGTVKKISGVFKLIHEYKTVDGKLAYDNYLKQYSNAIIQNNELQQYKHRITHDIDPLTTYELFVHIPYSDIQLLNCNNNRPENLLLHSILVPPVCIRPSVAMGATGTNEDDLTIKLGDILQINNYLVSAIQKGAQTGTLIDNWDFLQSQISMYINSDLPGFPKEIAGAGRQIRALSQRLKGKQGRFRGNLSGKRVDFSSRTVISPDPNLRIDQVGVPVLVAKTLTYPELVTVHNIKRLRECIINGCDVWPGANIIEHRATHSKTFLRYGNRKLLASNLQLGDVVERHLHDDDIVLFNRQPSLHRLSIMSHKAKILNWRTFRFNESVCTPYNADFDGDEMNLHVPQTEESRSEAYCLMSTMNNMVTPRHGEPLITATQDFLTTSFLITQKDVLYDYEKFVQICCMFNDADELLVIPQPCIFKPIKLWSGKQIMSMLLKPNNDTRWPDVNIQCKNKSYTGKHESMCARDGYCVIVDSVLMSGCWDKSLLGGDKMGLHYSLIRDFNVQTAAAVLNRLAKLSARWIGDRGFSIGLDDVTPSESLLQHKSKLLHDGYAQCDSVIEQYERNELPLQSGCNPEQTLEAVLLGELSSIRESLGSHCLNELDYQHNSPLIMTMCGSKGSKINISQMVACVGQQAVSGHRVPNGFYNRTLPHYKVYSRTPDAKGFVKNSFYSGLTATEFFMHTQGGREGLVDTAVKTAETGYMQRRLVKALEDLCVEYDGTVRTSNKNIVQFIYGDDGLDPIMMATDGIPVQYMRLYQQCQAIHDRHSKKLTDQQIEKSMIIMSTAEWTSTCSTEFISKTQKFITQLIDTVRHYPHQSCTEFQLSIFYNKCLSKYRSSRMESGTAVGAIAAQSIGEPGTQMTLKTFHFAGVASMNVTLGVPRIKEIINASKLISSPIITAPLTINNSIQYARIVKGRIERTLLGDICEYIDEIYSVDTCYLSIKIDLNTINLLQLNINVDTIARSIVAHKKLKLKYDNLACKSDDIIRIRLDGKHTSNNLLMYNLQRIKSELPLIEVSGVSTVNRAIINDNGNSTYNLLLEGYGLQSVMSTVGCDAAHCTSNHVLEMNSVLGIEAARLTIIKEINTTMDGHGLTVDSRHVSLLADIMTYRGEVLGITRFGIAKMKESVLMLASFEKTADHLFDAAVHGAVDEISGVSENIIMGQNIPIGTGLFQLIADDIIKHNQVNCTTSQYNNTNQLLLHGDMIQC